MDKESEYSGFPAAIEDQRTYLEGEGDKRVFLWVEGLRREVESDDGWAQAKIKAKEEIKDLPSDILPQIFERISPYLDLLPTGHSKGHTLRDFITTIELMRDPSLHDVDDVEKIVGILSGTFHDIGNALVNRYDEAKRFSGHAEVGAYIFGETARDLLPPYLLKLVQYAIAAHTHYTKDISITKKNGDVEEVVVKRPYNDELVNGNRMGIWLARWADRIDMQGLQGFARHSLTKATPTEDYSQEGFHVVREDEKEDFIHHFTPNVRSEDERSSLAPEQKTRNVLEHIQMFRESALKRSVYSQHDSNFFRETLVAPAAMEQVEFVTRVIQEGPKLEEDEVEQAFDTFYRVCRIIEPGKDIDSVIEVLREKFQLLRPEDRNRWAAGFIILDRLYLHWYARMEQLLNTDLDPSLSPQIKAIIEKGNELARQSLTQFRYK